MLYQTNKKSLSSNYYTLFSRALFLIALTTIFCSLGTEIRSQTPLQISSAIRDGAIDASFTPVLSQTRYSPGVSQAYPLPDGKILVAGSFKVANGVIKLNLARLNSDGTLDNSFGITLTGTEFNSSEIIIQQIAVQSDGKILIGGNFNAVNDIAANNIARLTPNGTFDSSFSIGDGFNSDVTAIALQADGKVLVGGNFSTFNGVSRRYLTRLNTDGSLDNLFNPVIGTGLTSPIKSISPLSNGKIFIQGFFNTVNSVLRRGLAKLNSDGTLDASFVEPGTYSAFNFMYDFAIRPDGKIYIGGFFEIRVNNQLVCQNLCLLNTDGTLDTSSFVSFNINNGIRAMYLQSDGKLLIHGNFENVNGVTRNGTTRLNNDGTIDLSFNPSFNLNNGSIAAFVPLPDGHYLLPGSFTVINGTTVENLARIDANGNLDSTFAPSFANLGGAVATAIQPDGKILVAGDFNRANGVIRGRFARFNPNGTLDASLNTTISNSFPGTSGFDSVNKIVLQPDGKILIGGQFGQVNGENHYYLARLNSDGSVDSNFNPIITYQGSGGGDILSIAVQADGKIIIGGAFQSVNGASRIGYARLNSDGSLDSSFVVPFDQSYFPSVSALLIHSNGKILIGGDFRITGNNSTLSVAQLNADGSLDKSFPMPTESQTPYSVRSIARQSDGKILIGGTWNFSNRPLLIRLNTNGIVDGSFNAGRIGGGYNSDRIYSIIPQPNGKILIAGSFSIINNNLRLNIARLIENGGLDFSFNASPGGTVLSMNQTADGNLIVAGAFNRVGTTPASGLARLQVTNLTRQPLFDFDGDGRDDLSVFRPSNGTWYLKQSTAGFKGVTFGVGTDKIVSADYDGDGKTDFAVYRSGTWYLQRSSLGFTGISFGDANDIPQPFDYDGDTRAELAIFRPSNGTWYLLNLFNGQFTGVAFGQIGDKPVAADYDGDGKADIAVYRPSNGVWYLQRSQLGFTGVLFGESADKPVPADYDGDGKTDIAVFRPSNGVWYLQQSTAGFAGIAFGEGTDLPVPADYDGDGKADISVFRPSNGVWYLSRSAQGFTGIAFGASGDKPVPNAFIP